MYIEPYFTVPGIIQGKRYKVIRVESLSKIWTRRFLIEDDLNELVWCYDDEAEVVN